MSAPNNQFSLNIAFKTKVNAVESSLKAASILSNFWVVAIFFILEYAPFISGLGAVGYGFASILSADVFAILVNKNIIVFFNILVGICGFITVCEWTALDFLLNMLIGFAKVISGNI